MERELALKYLQLDIKSNEFYELLSISNTQSRMRFGAKGYVFAQIGINSEPCSKNCRFCSLSSSNFAVDTKWRKSYEQIIPELDNLLKEGINDFFLMTTADYPIEEYIAIAKKLKKRLPENVKFVANIGDFDFETAKQLKDIGFTGAYHIKRLGEGTDTLIRPEIREQTIDNIIKAGLELYYCIEPIGPEHSNEEIIEAIFFAKRYPIDAMAVMRRIPVPGTPLFEKGQINAMELTKIVALTNLIIKPQRSMNAHEPIQMSLLAGVNQLYAEVGANPRDINSNTEAGRGFTPKSAWQMLEEGGYFSS